MVPDADGGTWTIKEGGDDRTSMVAARDYYGVLDVSEGHWR